MEAFLSPLLQEAQDKEAEDAYRAKMDALTKQMNDASTQQQDNLRSAGAGSAFGKAIDTATAPTMGVGNALLGVQPKNYSNAENIINANNQGTTSADSAKIKNLLDNYKMMNQGEGVAQDYAKFRDTALGKGASVIQNQEEAKIRADEAKNRITATSDAKTEKENTKLALDLTKDLDPNRSRAGNFAKPAAMKMAAERIEGLFKQFPDGNIPMSQTVELASAVAALVSGGSAPQSQQQINEIVPHSMAGDATKIAAWITNEPLGRQQKEFMMLMRDTAKREKNVAEKQLVGIKASRLPFYKKLKERDPETYANILSGHGLNPDLVDEKGQYKLEEISDPEDEDTQALDWAKKNAEDPRAKAIILKLSKKGVK